MDYAYPENITGQIDGTGEDGTNFKIVLEVSFYDPTECDYERTDVQCVVVVYEDLVGKLSIKSVDCKKTLSKEI